jgi:Arc/MetJ-type ribon-helix-helix transcriptional regulator
MSKRDLFVTLDAGLIDRIDALVEARRFPSRSDAIEAAVSEKLTRIAGDRLASECAKLDPAEERALAEERFEGEDPW